MKISKSPSSVLVPAVRLNVPSTCTVFIARSLSSPPIALRASASRLAPFSASWAWSLDSKPAEHAQNRERRHQYPVAHGSIIPRHRRTPSLSASKEIVKNVKALRSTCYSSFRPCYTAPREAGPARSGLTLLIGRPPGAAAGPRRAAVPLGRPGQRGRARADAAQPAQRRAPVPRRVRRRGGPRRSAHCRSAPITARDGASEQYTDRYEAWVDTSEYPETRLQHLRGRRAGGAACVPGSSMPQRHVFETAAWPRPLASLASGVRTTACATSTPASRSDRRGRRFPDDESLLIARSAT